MGPVLTAFRKPPKDQLFYKAIAFTMAITALNAQYWEWYKMPKSLIFHIQRIFIYFAVPIVLISQVVYLVLNYSEHEFNTLSMMYTVLPVNFMVLIKLIVSQTNSYKSAMRDFMSKIHLHNYYMNDRQDYIRKVLTTAENFARRSGYYYIGLCYICTASFEVVPIVHNIQNNQSTKNVTSRLEIMIHPWLPFDYEFNFYNYILVQVLVIYCGMIAITIVSVFDTITLTFLFHLTGHIKILKHRIRTSFRKDMTQEEIHDTLIELSRYYTFITRTLSNVEAAFGLNVAGIYLHNLIGGGLFIYQLMSAGSDTGTLLTYGLMIPIYMGILIIMSLTLESIRIEADDISDCIYALYWENMSLKNQKLVLMILFQVQPTLEFKAAFNIKTGMQPAISIIKTTFSFYVMIKSKDEIA